MLNQTGKYFSTLYWFTRNEKRWSEAIYIHIKFTVWFFKYQAGPNCYNHVNRLPEHFYKKDNLVKHVQLPFYYCIKGTKQSSQDIPVSNNNAYHKSLADCCLHCKHSVRCYSLHKYCREHPPSLSTPTISRSITTGAYQCTICQHVIHNWIIPIQPVAGIVLISRFWTLLLPRYQNAKDVLSWTKL